MRDQLRDAIENRYSAEAIQFTVHTAMGLMYSSRTRKMNIIVNRKRGTGS